MSASALRAVSGTHGSLVWTCASGNQGWLFQTLRLYLPLSKSMAGKGAAWLQWLRWELHLKVMATNLVSHLRRLAATPHLQSVARWPHHANLRSSKSVSPHPQRSMEQVDHPHRPRLWWSLTDHPVGSLTERIVGMAAGPPTIHLISCLGLSNLPPRHATTL